MVVKMNENVELNIIENFESTENDNENKKSQILEEDVYYKNVFSLLIQILDDNIQSGKVNKMEKALNDVEERYEKCEKKSEAVVMKIQETKYLLMCKYLENKAYEKATHFCNKFDKDMEDYIFNRVKLDIPNVVVHGNYYAAMVKVDISERVNINVKSLKFWEGILNVEKPELNYRLPAYWQPQNGMLLKENNILGIPITSFSYFGFLKVFKIHYDPQSELNNMNLLDIQRLKEYLNRNKVIKNIRIVFEEGIEDVYVDLDSINMFCNISVKLPSTAKTIGGNLFKGNVNISYVDMRKTQIEEIGENTFLNSNLEDIKFPYCLKLIGTNAFANCKNLRKVNLKNTSVRRINRHAFYGAGLKKIKFNSDVGTIELEAFGNCKDLRKLDLSNTGMTRIDSGILEDSGVTKIRLPKKLREIDLCAFSNCKELNEIDLSKTRINNIGPYAFFNSNVSIVRLPNTIKKIGYEAFAKCDNLKKLDLSKTELDTIEGYAFYCSGIKDVKFPKEIKNISETAFKDCEGFKTDNI